MAVCEYKSHCKSSSNDDLCLDLHKCCKIKAHNKEHRIRLSGFELEQEVEDMINLGEANRYWNEGKVV